MIENDTTGVQRVVSSFSYKFRLMIWRSNDFGGLTWSSCVTPTAIYHSTVQDQEQSMSFVALSDYQIMGTFFKVLSMTFYEMNMIISTSLISISFFFFHFSVLVCVR